MGVLFGTDGIRGEANSFLTAELAFKLGVSAAYVLTKDNAHAAKIVVGRDTRLSGDMLEAAFSAGAASTGAAVYLAGIIPTPALPIIIREKGYDAGCVISASHNSFEDNGLKLFDAKGYKLPDAKEEEIEGYMLSDAAFSAIPRPSGKAIGRVFALPDASDIYVAALKKSFGGGSLRGKKIALDCANGATYFAAPTAFRALGAETLVINAENDGEKINLNCGSTHAETLAGYVKETGADAGFSFDGDGDRLIAVDELGNIVDGDQIMSICGNYLKREGKLAKNTIVATIMSNAGFFKMGRDLGVNVVKTGVGDRYVLEEMLKNGYNFGGEQSGHIIFPEYNTTGDGIVTALQLLKAVGGETLSDANRCMTVFPQSLVNVIVKDKTAYTKSAEVMELIKRAEEELAKDGGRVLVRASGTENKIRVMVEGSALNRISAIADEIACAIKKIDV